MLFRKLALLAKIETIYNTDSVPTGAANAILARNVNVTPMQAQTEERGQMQPFLGHSGEVLTAFWGTVDFEVEIAGSGAAGTAPKVGPLLRGASLAEVITAGTKVTYTPISTGFESVSLYFHLDGVLHKFTGSRGTVSGGFIARAIPQFKFAYTGIFQPVVDAALPTAVYSGFTTPLAVNKINTPTFSIHGVTAVAQSITLDMANDVQYRNLINYEGVDNVDRAPVGEMVIEAGPVATKNWFDVAKTMTTGALSLNHGTTPGNIVTLAAPAVQITNPRYSETSGVAMLTAGLKYKPTTAGNDEFTIEFA